MGERPGRACVGGSMKLSSLEMNKFRQVFGITCGQPKDVDYRR